MKYLFIFIFLGLSQISHSQDIDEAINIVEDISNWEENFINKITYSNEIKFDKHLQKLVVTDSINFGNGEFTKYITRIYLEDIDINSMKYDYTEIETGKYLIAINLKMKSKSVEVEKLEITKKNKYLVSEIEYYDKINCFGANSRLLPLFLIKKYVQAVSELLGIKNYKKEILFKD